MEKVVSVFSPFFLLLSGSLSFSSDVFLPKNVLNSR